MGRNGVVDAVRTTRRVVPLILAGWLAACAGAQAPQTAFDLAPAVPHPQRPLRAQIHVLDPFAPTDLESDRILVRTGPTLAVLAGARWSAPLPILLQARLTESLQNAQELRKADDGGTVADYDLETEVRAFELDADQKQVVVEFVVKLVSARDNHIKAFKTFKTRAPVASTDPHEVTTALNGALSSVMAQIVAFVAASV